MNQSGWNGSGRLGWSSRSGQVGSGSSGWSGRLSRPGRSGSMKFTTKTFTTECVKKNMGMDKIGHSPCVE